MAPFDKEWISWAMFSAKGKLATALKLWWNPLQVQHRATTPPHPDIYHYRRLLLWVSDVEDADCAVEYRVPTVQRRIQLYVRLVVDEKNIYYTECRTCSGTFPISSHLLSILVKLSEFSTSIGSLVGT
jgi:hypothetical protein